MPRVWRSASFPASYPASPGHRLKFGHSIEFLPEVVERFGYEGVPGFVLHLLQDFTTTSGIPVLPNAWAAKEGLAALGVAPKLATGLVSLSFAKVLAALALGYALHRSWQAFHSEKRQAPHVKRACKSLENHDYAGAISNYLHALEVNRTPAVLIALGQVFARRAANRLRAHRAFMEASERLSSQPDLTVEYQKAQVSLRGLAALESLSTCDVLANINPEHWRDHVQDLVNAAVYSFSVTGSKLEHRADQPITNPPAFPPLGTVKQ